MNSSLSPSLFPLHSIPHRSHLTISMDCLFLSNSIACSTISSFSSRATLPSPRGCRRVSPSISRPLIRNPWFVSSSFLASRRTSADFRIRAVMANDSISTNNDVYTVGDFMTTKENLHVVKPTTSIDEALQMLVENRIKGFPVIDEDWNLVGVVSDYDLLALDSISGGGQGDRSLFPEVDSTWKMFKKIQKLLSKTQGKVIADVMTSSPLVVRETTNIEDAARLLLKTKYRRLPVVDSAGKLVGILTRGNIISAALKIKHANENHPKSG